MKKVKTTKFNIEQIKFLSMSFRIFGVTLFLSSINQKTSIIVSAVFLLIWILSELVGFLILRLINFLPKKEE